MLSNRKKIAVSASLMMATAGIVASAQTAAPATTSSPASARQKAAVTVSIVPGVIGPGGGLQTGVVSGHRHALLGEHTDQFQSGVCHIRTFSSTATG